MLFDRKVFVIIPAAGSGKRMNIRTNKLLLDMNGEPVIHRTIEAFNSDFHIDEIIIVTEDKDIEREAIKFEKVRKVVRGGKERIDSVYNALRYVDGGSICLVHDGARPFVRKEVIERVLAGIKSSPGVIPAVRVKDTVKMVVNGKVERTLDRGLLYNVQTPQGFDTDVLKECYDRAIAEGFFGTDDASLLEHYGYEVSVVEGDYKNIKITTKEDVFFLGKEGI